MKSPVTIQLLPAEETEALPHWAYEVYWVSNWDADRAEPGATASIAPLHQTQSRAEALAHLRAWASRAAALYGPGSVVCVDQQGRQIGQVQPCPPSAS